jgi:hypothetical protein
MRITRNNPENENHYHALVAVENHSQQLMQLRITLNS